MKMRNPIMKTLALPLLVLAATTVVRAQLRTYVATSGNDNNACTTALPCRTFQGAHDKTSPEGKVVALDTGTFGKTLTITKSITIAAAPGIDAGLTTGIGQTAITISAGVHDVVAIQNLSLDGHAVAARGIDFQSGGKLHVDGCVIGNFTGAGILLDAQARAFVTDTTVRNNHDGIFVSTGDLDNSTDSVSIDHCRAEANFSKGFYVSLSKATIRDSIATGNGLAGFYCYTGVMNITGCLAANNQTGVFVEAISSGTGTARIAYSTVTAT